MNSQLEKIDIYKKEELEHRRRKVSLKDVQLKSQDQEPAIDFLQNFNSSDLNIIAEVKKASPSAGIIRQDFRPLEIAQIYEDNGAKALSVLTDEHFFQGHLDYLVEIKKYVSLPCLRKDFTLNEYHLYEARGACADAILLIVAILDDHQLKDYQALTRELGMKAIVEVHSQEELDRALNMTPDILGVNNRDLHRFVTDIEISKKLKKNIPDSIPAISESGLKQHKDLRDLHDIGYQGFLIGETLMRENQIGQALKRMLEG